MMSNEPLSATPENFDDEREWYTITRTPVVTKLSSTPVFNATSKRNFAHAPGYGRYLIPGNDRMSNSSSSTASASSLFDYRDIPADMSGNLDHSSTPSPPPRVSQLEATQDYWGLPSKPLLTARTGGPWDPPTGPEAYPKAKELRSLGGQHELFSVWEDDLALEVHKILDQKLVNWSSTEIVRIAYVDEPDGNLVLWIGIYSTPTLYEVGVEGALQCRRLLLSYGIQDVVIELRESDFVQSAGPATAIPFTTSLGLNIRAENTPWDEGALGFFMAVDDVDKLYGVTARHVGREDNKARVIREIDEDELRKAKRRECLSVPPGNRTAMVLSGESYSRSRQVFSKNRSHCWQPRAAIYAGYHCLRV